MTDRQTDILVADAVLSYIAQRSKIFGKEVVLCVWQNKKSFVMLSVVEMLQYCRDELAKNCIPSQQPSSSAASLGHWRSSDVTECSWQVATISDSDLHPAWVCCFDSYTVIFYTVFQAETLRKLQ